MYKISASGLIIFAAAVMATTAAQIVFTALYIGAIR